MVEATGTSIPDSLTAAGLRVFMRPMKKSIPLLVMACLLGGCQTTEVVNDVDVSKPELEFEYYEDGSKKSPPPHVNSEEHGMGIVYREDGSKLKEIIYENDKVISP